MQRIWKKYKVRLLWIVGVVGVWELVAFLLQTFHVNMASQKLPYLHDIIYTFLTNFMSLLQSGMVTLSRAFIGFLLGAAIGFAFAIFMSASRLVEKVIFPYMIILQMIPVLAMAPIIFTIVRDPDTARIVIAAFITFFPVAVNMLGGIKSVEQEKRDLMYSYASSKWTTYIKLYLPASLSSLLIGLKLAAPSSITAAILVEMLGTDEGIGIKILYTLYYGASGANLFWASVLMAALLGIISCSLLGVLERKLVPWELKDYKKAGEA